MSIKEPSNIDKTRKISNYEEKYGEKDIMRFTMTFEIMKWSIVGLFIFIFLGIFGVPVLSKYIGWDIPSAMGIFKDCLGILGAIIMAFAGYFFGRKT